METEARSSAGREAEREIRRETPRERERDAEKDTEREGEKEIVARTSNESQNARARAARYLKRARNSRRCGAPGE